jgi:hypothetical protein
MVLKIISGGQTGADTGGLYGARDAGIPTGGFAPYNFLTEKGNSDWLATKFGLVDSNVGYKERTLLNVKNSDITIWFGTSHGSAGYWATRNGAMRLGKPFKEARIIDLSSVFENYKIINIAGNRESHNPGICQSTREKVRNAIMAIKGIQTKIGV